MQRWKNAPQAHGRRLTRRSPTGSEYGEISPRKHQWLGGAERFTAADLNVSVVLGWCYYLSKLFEPFPRVTDWMKRCHSRPLSPYNRVPPAYSQKAGVPGKEGAFPWDTAGFDERYSKL